MIYKGRSLPKWLAEYLNGLDKEIEKLKSNREHAISAYQREKQLVKKWKSSSKSSTSKESKL